MPSKKTFDNISQEDVDKTINLLKNNEDVKVEVEQDNSWIIKVSKGNIKLKVTYNVDLLELIIKIIDKDFLVPKYMIWSFIEERINS
jgi:hypothetical protein